MSSSFQFEPISLVWKQDVLEVLMSSLVIKDKISARLNNLSLLNKNSNLHSHPEYMKVFFLSELHRYNADRLTAREYEADKWRMTRRKW